MPLLVGLALALLLASRCCLAPAICCTRHAHAPLLHDTYILMSFLISACVCVPSSSPRNSTRRTRGLHYICEKHMPDHLRRSEIAPSGRQATISCAVGTFRGAERLYICTGRLKDMTSRADRRRRGLIVSGVMSSSSTSCSVVCACTHACIHAYISTLRCVERGHFADLGSGVQRLSVWAFIIACAHSD